MNFLPALIGATIIGLSVPALAQEHLPKPGPGQTLITVSATERTEATQDLLIATLRVEKEGSDVTALQADINTIMGKALAAARAVGDVKTSTDNYYVYPYDPQPVPADKTATPAARTWRGGQSLTLQGTNAEALLQLAGTLQGMGLSMNGLSYTLSPERLEAIKDGLMEGALNKVKSRAERAAKALGKGKTELVDISIDSSMPDYPRPVMMAMKSMDSAAEAMPMPVSEPGRAEVSLTVTARAMLSP